MTPREHKSMVAMKRMIDAYHELPLSVRLAIAGKLDNEIGGLQAALSEYKTEMRESVNTAAKEVAHHSWGASSINH